MTRPPFAFIRRVLLLDAVTSGVTGAGLVLMAGPLAGLLALPADLLRGAGLALLPFAAAVAWLGSRDRPSPRAVRVIVVLNLLWAVDSALIVGLGWVTPNGLGVAFIALQAVAVAALAGLQVVGLRRAPAVA